MMRVMMMMMMKMIAMALSVTRNYDDNSCYSFQKLYFLSSFLSSPGVEGGSMSSCPVTVLGGLQNAIMFDRLASFQASELINCVVVRTFGTV